jgi:hypothetical protein
MAKNKKKRMTKDQIPKQMENQKNKQFLNSSKKNIEKGQKGGKYRRQ